MAATKKSSTKKAAQQADTAKRQLLSVIWFAVSVFFLCVVFIKGQNLWLGLHNIIFGIFGVTAYFYPFLFFYSGNTPRFFINSIKIFAVTPASSNAR